MSTSGSQLLGIVEQSQTRLNREAANASEALMTVITVNTPAGRLPTEQRRTLAQTLTDAVLVPEVGQHEPAARVGFQVHFREYQPDSMALGGVLVADFPEGQDVMVIDVAVMDADWGREVREQVISRLLQAMAAACGLPSPQPDWWVTFRVTSSPPHVPTPSDALSPSTDHCPGPTKRTNRPCRRAGGIAEAMSALGRAPTAAS